MLYLAAVLLFLLGLAHSLLGERYILVRLFRRDNLPRLFGSPEFTVRTLRFAWHITTVAWWGLAALLVAIAQDGFGPPETGATVARIIGWTAIISGLLPLILTRGKHWSWLVLFVVGALLLAGTGDQYK